MWRRSGFARALAAMALLGAASGSAQAALTLIEYRSVSGQSFTVAPNARYINPSEQIHFTLSAGLDRRVRVSLLRSDGTVASTAISDLLGAEDRITVNGEEMYGARLTVPVPADGEYTVRAEITDAAGKVIEAESHPLVIDTTAPSFGAILYNGMDEYAILDSSGAPLHFGDEFTVSIMLEGVRDSSGIDRVEARTVFLDGPNRGKTAAEGRIIYDAGQETAALGGGKRTLSKWYPENRRAYRTEFHIYDNAGNRSVATHEHTFNNDCGELPVPVAAHRPGSTNRFLGQHVFEGFEPWSDGGVLYENPVTLIWRLPRSNWAEETVHGIRFGTPDYIDSEYVYRKITRPLTDWVDANDGHFGSYTRWGCKAFSDFRGTLAPGVPETPKVVGKKIHYDGAWHNGSEFRVNTPTKVKALRVDVEPRSYPQTVRINSVAGALSCEVPAGQSYCIIDGVDWTPPAERGYSPWSVYVRDAGGNFNVFGNYFYFYWDYDAPYFVNFEMEQDARRAILDLHDPHTTSDWTNPFWKPSVVEIIARDEATGQQTRLSPVDHQEATTNNHRYTFDFSSLATGHYSITAYVRDTFGNERTQSYDELLLVDQDAPSVVILKGSEPLEGSVIRSLDEVVVELADALDAEPRVTSIVIEGGPANDRVSLGWRREGLTYRLEYPVMFPSLKEGDYRVTVTAKDWQGNTATSTSRFSYDPPRVQIAGETAGEIAIPAVPHAFHREDGLYPLTTEPLRLADGSVVNGTYDVFATLRSDSSVPLVVNGVRIEPGDTMAVLNAHNFATTGGRLSLPVRAAEPGQAGRAHLLVTTAAPNAPVGLLTVNVWAPRAVLTSPSWTLRQVVDPVDIAADADPSSGCALTADPEVARQAAVLENPVCLLEWRNLPDLASVDPENGLHLTGQALAEGEQVVGYELYLFDATGEKILAGQAQRKVTVVSAKGSIGLKPRDPFDQVYRTVEELYVRLVQSKGPECELTTRVEKAIRAGEIGRTDVCFVEWTGLPDGIDPLGSWSGLPEVSGILTAAGPAELRWRASVFSLDGTSVTVAEEGYSFEVVDPPLPQIALPGVEPNEHGIYPVEVHGGRLGVISATVPAGDLTLEVDPADGSPVKVSEYRSWARSDEPSVAQQYVRTAPGELWEVRKVRAVAYYSALPELRSEATFEVMLVPSKQVSLALDLPPEALDTTGLNLAVKVGRLDGSELVYEPKTMGAWTVSVGERSREDWRPLLEGIALGGDGAARAHIADLEVRTLTLTARGVVTSPDGRYRRELESYPRYVTVLHGAGPEGDLLTRRLSGVAPWTTVLTLSLERDWQRVLGEVRWEVSRDGGQSWEVLDAGQGLWRTVQTFQEGIYLVRASLTNNRSGAVGKTETIELNAFRRPEIEADAPEELFTGTDLTVTAKTTLDGAPVDTVIEWVKEDEVVAAGPSLVLDNSAPTLHDYRVRARMPNAPADNPLAWVEKRVRIRVREPAPPRVLIRVPQRVEVGHEYAFNAQVRLPYRGLPQERYPLRLEWVMPDGTVRTEAEPTYRPTEAEAEQRQVAAGLRVWVEGYKEQTLRELSRRIVVIRYVWPEFEIRHNQRMEYAPTDVSFGAMPVEHKGSLEDPRYEWVLPPGAELLRDYGRIVQVRFHEPGDHVVRVRITDARGNEAQASTVIALKEPPPYAVSLDLRPSNPDFREPLDVRVLPKVSGGHPYDRPTDFRYYLDGELVSEGVSTGRFFGLKEGTHQLRLEMVTKMGVRVTQAETVEVTPNIPPTCKIERTHRPFGPSWKLEAQCQDDGRVVGYRWTFNGEPLTLSGNRLLIPDGEGTEIVTFEAVDNAGASYRETLILE